MTVGGKYYYEPVEGLFALWVCLAPGSHDGYRLMLAPKAEENKLEVIIEKAVEGVYGVLAKTTLSKVTEAFHFLEVVVAGGNIEVSWEGEVIVSVADATYAAGHAGLEGEGNGLYGFKQFALNGIVVDNLEREETPLGGGRWAVLPWAENTGKCYSAEFGWTATLGRSGAYWGEVAPPPIASAVIDFPDQ